MGLLSIFRGEQRYDGQRKAPFDAAGDIAQGAEPPIRLSDAVDDLDGLVIGIEYVDAQGAWSRRSINVRGVSWGDDYGTFCHLSAYCYAAESKRTFRSDRIQVIRLRGGVIEGQTPTEFFGRFLGPPRAQVLRDRAYRREQEHEARRRQRAELVVAIRSMRAGLVALAALAASCGDSVEAEVAILRDYLRWRLSSLPADVPVARLEALQLLAEGIAPSRAQISAAAKVLADEPEEIEALAPFIRRVVTADGVVTDNEIAALRSFREMIDRYRAPHVKPSDAE